MLLQASPPMASCLCFYKTLSTGHLQERTRVVARREARVRSQQHGRAVCGQRPLGEKETFFGDFLPFSKKLPAPWSGSFCSKTSTSKARSLDSRVRGNDERREKSWIPAFAGMTSGEPE